MHGNCVCGGKELCLSHCPFVLGWQCGGVLVTMEMGNGQIEILFTCRALPQGNQTLSIVLVAAGDKEDGGG